VPEAAGKGVQRPIDPSPWLNVFGKEEHHARQLGPISARQRGSVDICWPYYRARQSEWSGRQLVSTKIASSTKLNKSAVGRRQANTCRRVWETAECMVETCLEILAN
jgi:hypothetical protein